MKKHTKYILGISILIFLGLLIASMVFSYMQEGLMFSLINNDFSSVVAAISSFGGIAIIIFILLIILEVIFAPIPPFILYIVGGSVFGSFLGGTYALIGNVIGAGIAFQIARTWGRSYVEKRISVSNRKRFDNFSEKYGPVSIFLLRINPLTSTDLFSYAAGLTKMNFWKFLLGTTFGLIPTVYIQSYLGDVFTGNPVFNNLFIALSFFYILIFVGIYIYSKLKKKKK